MSDKSAEQIVRERWPDAWALRTSSGTNNNPLFPLWKIAWKTPCGIGGLGCGVTEAEAWADAAKRIESELK